MSDVHPLPFQMRHLPGGGVRFMLPGRQLGAARWLGVFVVAFGMVFSGFAVYWMAGVLAAGSGGTSGSWSGVLFALFGLPFVLGGLVPIGIGLAIMFGRSSVEIRDGRLRSIEHIGPVRWPRSRRIDDLSGFEVYQPPRDGGSSSVAAISRLSAIHVTVTSDGKPFLLAPGYAPNITRPLADALALEITQRRGTPMPIRLTTDGHDTINAATGAVEPAARPDQTDIGIERREGEVTITIPPAGFFKGSKGIGCFALLWLGFCAVFTAGITIAAVQGNAQNVWIFFAFISLFWLVGAGMLVLGLNMGRRRAILDVVGDVLLVSRQSLFGVKVQQFDRAAIDSIALGPSGMEVNDVPVNELQIRLHDKSKVGMLSSRADDELRWIVSELRTALRLSEVSPD